MNYLDTTHKVCSKCKLSKKFSEFSKDKSNKTGYAHRCKSCCNLWATKWRIDHREAARDYARKWRKQNPNIYRENQLIRNFGITLEQYNQMLSEQNGCCKLCERHHSEFKVSLSVDHCHITGKVRGLLCGNCNMALGLLQDSKEIIKRMLNYL